MFLQQLFEAIDKRHAAFCFGRMNPPTIGHKQLADTVANAAAGGDYFIFTSQTQDSKKNPLDYATKVKFLKALMPEHASHIVQDTNLKTIIQVAQWLYAKGYRSVTFVAGSDRLANFKELLEKYNGVQGQAGFYQFDSINFVSSGDRDPDADGVEGISASLAREAAATGNLEAFAQATGAGKLAKPLYDAVRKGMLLEGTFTNSEVRSMPGSGRGEWASNYTWKHDDKYGWHVRDPKGVVVYKAKSKEAVKSKCDELNNSLKECSGYIPKNKREAKDPRWSNALTVDVHPDTPTKNLKALKLV